MGLLFVDIHFVGFDEREEGNLEGSGTNSRDGEKGTVIVR